MRKLQPREITMLGLLAVALVIALWISQGGGFGGGDTAEELEPFGLGEPPRIAMNRLDLEPVDYDPRARNLFDYYTPPRAAPRRTTPPPSRTPPPPPPPRVKPPQPVQPSQRAAETTAKPPTPPFDFIGRLGPQDSMIAVLEPRSENDILLHRLGDVVLEEFRIVEIKYDALVLGYTNEQFAGMTTELAQKSR